MTVYFSTLYLYLVAPHPKGKVGYAPHAIEKVLHFILYNAVNVMVVPLKQEALGQMTLVTHACGTPVVAFNLCGLTDTARHQETNL
jgi:hypothetical protein